MNKYESIIIIKPTLTKEEIESEIRKYEQYFKNLSDYKVEVENMGLKKLAYEIKGNKEGAYALFKFCGVTKNITELEKQYRLDDNIMKFITINVQPEYEEEYIEKDEIDEEYEQKNLELKNKVVEKVNNEYEQFIDDLKEQTNQEIIDKAYEIVCKEEIIDTINDLYFDNDKCDALLKSSNILSECYDEWLKTDGHLRGNLDYAVEKTIKHIENDFKYVKKKEDTKMR